MEIINSLFKEKYLGELVLIILFSIYLNLNYPIPHKLAQNIDTLFGKIIVITIALSLFAYTDPVLAIFGLLVAFNLIYRSAKTTGSDLSAYMPSEAKKMSEFTAYNQFPYTLEQEIVKERAPIHKSGFFEGNATFKPILENLHDAAPLMGTD
jgi:hypothetical protein